MSDDLRFRQLEARVKQLESWHFQTGVLVFLMNGAFWAAVWWFDLGAWLDALRRSIEAHR